MDSASDSRDNVYILTADGELPHAFVLEEVDQKPGIRIRHGDVRT
jgi:hypothetical protein